MTILNANGQDVSTPPPQREVTIRDVMLRLRDAHDKMSATNSHKQLLYDAASVIQFLCVQLDKHAPPKVING